MISKDLAGILPGLLICETLPGTSALPSIYPGKTCWSSLLACKIDGEVSFPQKLNERKQCFDKPDGLHVLSAWNSIIQLF